MIECLIIGLFEHVVLLGFFLTESMIGSGIAVLGLGNQLAGGWRGSLQNLWIIGFFWMIITLD